MEENVIVEEGRLEGRNGVVVVLGSFLVSTIKIRLCFIAYLQTSSSLA